MRITPGQYYRRLRHEPLEDRRLLAAGPIVVQPIADVAVSEDAAPTQIDLAQVFSDPEAGAALSYAVTAPASVPGIASLVSEAEYTHVLQDLLYTHLGANRGYGAEHDLARGNIANYFAAQGLTTTLEPFVYNSVTYYNVVGAKPGLTRPNDVYIVGAHFDSVYNPGADDNGSGTAAVLEAARVLADYQFDCTLRFIAFDREEQGMRGSYAYAAAHAGDHILGMVNLDMIAYNPQGSNHDTVRLYDVNAAGTMKSALDAAFAAYGRGVDAIDTGQNGQSDHKSFEDRGFDAALVIEYEVWSNPYYHSPLDSVDTAGYIDYAFATKVTAAVTGYLASAAGLIPSTALLSAAVDSGLLRLTYQADQHGTCDITVRASDPAGSWAEDTFRVTVTAVPDVIGRHVFYNNSAFDESSGSPGLSNDTAIADTSLLLPGQTASGANYTSYKRGLNGLLIDFDALPVAPAASDFRFQIGNTGRVATWRDAPEPAEINLRPQAGGNGGHRLELIWADGAITNTWLQVTLLANAHTGLAADEVFYVGNCVGEVTGDGATGSPDLAAIFQHNGQLVTAPNPYDVDGNGAVGLSDVLAGLRQLRVAPTLAMIQVPPAPQQADRSERAMLGTGPTLPARAEVAAARSAAGDALFATTAAVWPGDAVRPASDGLAPRRCRVLGDESAL